MNPDRQVSPKTILAAIAEFKRRGSSRLMEELERIEPDLAEHLFESLTTIYCQLLKNGASHRSARRIYHTFQSLVFVVILALRRTHEAGLEDLPPGRTTHPPSASLSGEEEAPPRNPVTEEEKHS